ncbi:23S rRNA pseudouridylate synthase B, partial [Acidovorax cattleyae]|nr:23S rRNA pseudouridylate synthase B [Paracidovorax cattleyae]
QGGPGGPAPRGDYFNPPAGGRGKRAEPSSSQPDPMKTSVGYIGSDSLARHRQDQKQKRKAFQKRGGR